LFLNSEPGKKMKRVCIPFESKKGRRRRKRARERVWGYSGGGGRERET
jgi:hypothetical protein